MSVPRKTVVLSPDARVDFTDILLYTQREWGEEQAHRYEAILEQAIAALADHPEAGVRQDIIYLGCRIRPMERHVLYYQLGVDAIEAVRILYERADATRVFGIRHS